MKRVKCIVWLGGIVLWLATGESGAEPSVKRALELDLIVGFALPTMATDAENAGGGASHLQVRYRTLSGISGHLELGFAHLFSSSSYLPGPSPGLPTLLKSSLDSWLVLGGMAVDLWRLRLEGGIGLSVLAVRSSLGETEISPNTFNVAYALALTGFFYEGLIRLGAGLRAVFLDGADSNYVVFGFQVGGDPFRW